MDAFLREAIARLPLAEAVLTLLDYVADEPTTARVFEEHRGTGSERSVSLRLLARLICEALVEHEGSGRRSFRQAREAGRLQAVDAAVYGKLRRVPTEMSAAFLAATTDRLRDVAAPAASASPASLAGYRIVVVDGKKLKQFPKRLKALRSAGGAVLGGKVLVGLLLNEGLIAAMHASPDGEANDAPLTPRLCADVEGRFAGPLLYVADRQFCDLTIPPSIVARGHSFLIRYSRKMTFSAESTTRSTDPLGQAVCDEQGLLGSTADPRRLRVRRITLARAEGEEVALVTNLYDPSVSAADLLDLYRERWEIERVFQQLVEVFGLQRWIGSTPQGAVFQFALCGLLYNLLQVVRRGVAEPAGRSPRSLSSENLLYDVRKQLLAAAHFSLLDHLTHDFGAPPTAETIRRWLCERLTGLYRDAWLKAPPKKKSTPTKKRPVPGGHVSAWKLIQQAKAKPPPR